MKDYRIEIIEALSLNGQQQYDYILRLLSKTRTEAKEIYKKWVIRQIRELDGYKFHTAEDFISRTQIIDILEAEDDG